MNCVRGSEVIPGKGDCVTKRLTNRLFQCDWLDKPPLQAIYTMSDCICNEVSALKNTHHKAGPAVDAQAMKLLRECIIQGPTKMVAPISREAVISCYKGRKGREFLEAYNSLKECGHKKRDARIRMFLKADKYDTLVGLKPPRAIQYRDKRYSLLLAQHLRPIEHQIYKGLDWTGTAEIAKMRNPEQRASDVLRKWNCFDEPCAYLMDHSKFDSHVTVEMLEAEFAYYLKWSPRTCMRRFRYFLSLQLYNRGVTRNGTRYRIKGTRMSGELNTGLGNSTINRGLLRWYMASCGITKYSIYVDGDDSILVIERRDVHKLKNLKEFERVGMETKGELVFNFQDIDFCQSKLVEVDGRWIFVRNPFRLLSRTPWTIKKCTETYRRRLIYSLGMCEGAIGVGIPIAQQFAKALRELVGVQKLVPLEEIAYGSRWRGYSDATSMVTADTRESYFRAFGLTPEYQMAVEESIKVRIGDATDVDSNNIESVRCGISM